MGAFRFDHHGPAFKIDHNQRKQNEDVKPPAAEHELAKVDDELEAELVDEGRAPASRRRGEPRSIEVNVNIIDEPLVLPAWDDDPPDYGKHRKATRISYAASSLSRQFVATIVRVVVAAAVLIVIAYWLFGTWHWWPVVAPALVGLWWLRHVWRENRHYLRRGGMPPPVPNRWRPW